MGEKLERKDVAVSANGMVRIKARRDADRKLLGTVQRFRGLDWRSGYWDYAIDGLRSSYAFDSRSEAIQALLDEVNANA